MSRELLVERLFEALINGDRPSARAIVQETITQGVPAATLLADLLWPTHEMIEKLYRSDQMTGLAYHLSTRLLRMLVDQGAARLTIPASTRGTVFACCGPSQGEELAAQMACDMLEASGFSVTFTGGGIPADEIVAQVQDRKPTYLLMFASAASDLPDIRQIVDTLREIGAASSTKVVVGGGVFNRADGLAEEIGAHQWAYSPADLVDLLTLPPETAATVGTVPAATPVKTATKRKPRLAQDARAAA